MNVHSIVLEIPAQGRQRRHAPSRRAPNAAQTVGVWASASRRKVDVLRADGNDDHYGPWRPGLAPRPAAHQRDGHRPRRTRTTGTARRRPTTRRSSAATSTTSIAARDAEAVGFYAPAARSPICNIQNGGPPLTNRLADLVPVINLASPDTRRRRRSRRSATCSASTSARRWPTSPTAAGSLARQQRRVGRRGRHRDQDALLHLDQRDRERERLLGRTRSAPRTRPTAASPTA